LILSRFILRHVRQPIGAYASFMSNHSPTRRRLLDPVKHEAAIIQRLMFIKNSPNTATTTMTPTLCQQSSLKSRRINQFMSVDALSKAMRLLGSSGLSLLN
jgi:cell division inhibitor SulA